MPPTATLTPAPTTVAQTQAVGLARTVAALLLGYGYALAFARPEHWWWSLLALAGLIWLADMAAAPGTAAVKRVAWLGFAFGLAAFMRGLAWLTISMHEFGGLPAWQAWAALAGFAAYLALFPALALALWHAASRFWLPGTGNAALELAAWVSAWWLSEWLRGWLFTGFPWLQLGYAQSQAPLAGLAPLGGVALVTAAAAACAWWLARALRIWRAAWSNRTNVARTEQTGQTGQANGGLTQVAPTQPHTHRSQLGAWLSLLLLLAVLLTAQQLRTIVWTQPEGEPLHVALLQGNVAQEEKFANPGVKESLHIYGNWLRTLDADLIVTPETAFPIPLAYWPAELREALFQRAQTRLLLIGSPWQSLSDDANADTSNAVLALGQGATLLYEKRHLVPFGEFIPPGFHWFTRLMQIPLGDLRRGAAFPQTFTHHGTSMLTTICYENLFGEELRERLLSLPSLPGLLLNQTNLGWFGHSEALPQHREISRLRALELGRPLLASTNTGMTLWLDAQGRTRGELAPATRGVLRAELQGMQGTTPYLRWGNLALALTLALLWLGAALWHVSRLHRSPS